MRTPWVGVVEVTLGLGLGVICLFYLVQRTLEVLL